MKLSSRKQSRLALAGWMFLALAAALPAAQAQTGKWPEKVVRIIVATGPGGGDDFTTRLIAPKLGELLGQQFIVENRPGAGGMIGQTMAVKAPPDGYTLLLAGGSMAGARYVNASITYDVLRDFTPVSLIETSQFIMLVHPTVPARNAKEYVALARSQPGKMTYATLEINRVRPQGLERGNNRQACFLTHCELYKSGNPELRSLTSVLEATGLRIAVKPI